MTLPISVIVPHQGRRREFFRNVVYTSIARNYPSEIIVISNEHLGANAKRNEGFKRSTQPFIFFCDDDVELEEGCLAKMLLRMAPKTGVCYSDYERVIHPGIDFPFTPGVNETGFGAEKKLEIFSAVPMPSLIRRAAFPLFDEKLRRSQDRDLYIRILQQGWEFKYVPESLYKCHQIEQNSITTTEDYDTSDDYILRKYGWRT